MIDARKFFIGGKWVDPINGTDRHVIDSATEDPIATISLGGSADADAAVAAAKSAFPSWSVSTREERLGLLEEILAIYRRRRSELADAVTNEMGAPTDLSNGLHTALGEIHIEAFIEVLKNFDFGHALRPDRRRDHILYEPIGVCALITPWNWPLNQMLLKVLPAMATGCTSVLKPSEEAPLSALIIAEIFDEAGVPAGVFNLVNGDGAGVGNCLTAHPDVDLVSFTGSTRAGVAITKNAADTVKRVSLELGGKGANIIFADAVENAVKAGARRCFNNSGQTCIAPTRMLVERSRYDQAVKEATEVAESLSVDLPQKSGAHIGPVVNASQFDRIQNYIDIGIQEGANLTAGGPGRPDGHNRGYFVKPTVFADCTTDMTIVKEEIFGPVLTMMPFDTEEDAIAFANDTPFGLANYIQTSDGVRANRVARALRSGMVEINNEVRAPGSPFGGYKQSGNGREGGTWGFEEFLEVKSVTGWFSDEV
ncbi:aldehyde dehydrogenase [Roseobacter cerasinus]|uniref:aldehyde dehydrogenase (NAD(+)) n=1 Tax=Roseobacter cerasinus TaxID=2602289 RepID=A0A640VYH4_9RHOB|nr:aldehyde dehydrogenase family protein [Roseobacter cerasinus]GFE52440.1 aldehyde dehydrogenase [Roseobacter cerasinus]